MEEKSWSTKWEELNTRSRWYSSQLWYIPFAYIGIVGLSFEKISNLPFPINIIINFLFGIFTLAVFVHVSAIKYYERKAVINMQQLEGKNLSSGFSPWFISFAFYIRFMLILANYFFFLYPVWLIPFSPYIKYMLLALIFVILTVLFIVIISYDFARNRKLKDLSKVKL
jgi:hypothetical protein